MKKSAGFSLIDAVLILAIISVVGFAISKFIPDSISASLAAQETVDFATSASLVRRTLSNMNSCNTTVNTAPTFAPGGSTLTTIYMPNGTTPLITNGGNIGDGLTNVSTKLLDLGSVFSLDTFHLGAIQITATRKGYTGLNATMTSTKYLLLNTTSPTNFNCTVNYFHSDPGGQPYPISGSGVGGSWVAIRYGDHLSDNPPVPGTVDIAYGTGVTIGPGPYTLNPPDYFAPFTKDAQHWAFVTGNGSWTAFAYKLW